MFYSVGTLLNIKGFQGKVIGFIEYANPNDGNKTWIEYRIKTKGGEIWLSYDEIYDEYSISWPANQVQGRIGPEWHQVDSGTQVVRRFGGDVDVDIGERASFVEYEDASEEKTLSVEMWSDGTEYSMGEYVERSEIINMGFEKPKKSSNNGALAVVIIFAVVVIAFANGLPSLIGSILTGGKKIERYVKKSSYFTYETTITGNEKQKADVYKYDIYGSTTDTVAKEIIQGIEGETESVTQMDETADQPISIVTKKEYCYIYHPEDNSNVTYVQVSGRKYNYTSNNAPYKSSSIHTTWYRSHYYSSAFTTDSSSFKSSPSAYSMYNGSTIHNIGNGYFDSYSNTVRQSSINSRKSSSGGVSSGK